jgi:tetratricopeptide (TPR) repeat protein
MSQIPTKVPPGPGFRARLIAFCGKQWPRYFFLGAIGLIIRLPAIQGQLIWDDVCLTRDNPFIKSPLLALEAFRHYLFLDSLSGHYRPVQNLSYMFDYFFWNTDPAGFHLSNIFLHVGAGLLLYRLLTHLFGKGVGLWDSDDPGSARAGALAAFIISGIWMVHPVHSAAIDYISGRADSLAFVFSAGAWLLVLRARITKTPWVKAILYFLAALAGVLALCSREIACIWMLIFLVHTLAFTREISKKGKITTIVCCALVLGAYAELRQLPVGRAEKGFTENWSAAVRGTLMLRALGDYGRLMVFPGNLHMERSIFDPGNYLSRESWRKTVASEYLSILGLVVLAAFIYGCARRGIGQRARIMGTVWFFVAYLPISNIVQLNATVAEHWLYLPSVGFLLFLGGCALDLPRRFGAGLTAMAAIAILALSVRSTIRSSDWSNEEKFYKRTLAAGGTSCRVGVNLGQIYANRGEYAIAEKMFRHILETNPDYPIARNNLANVLVHEGKVAEGEALFARDAQHAKEASVQYPRTWIAVLNLAHMRSRAKDDAGAIAVLERARADYPEVWELMSLESELVRRTQGPLPALHLIENYTRQNWWHHAAWLAEGRLYAENNDVAQSTRALRYAALLDVHDVQALNLLAAISVRQNQLEQACATQRRAITREPNQPRQYLMLAEILDKMGRTSEAQNARDDATRLRAIAMSPRIAAN